MTARLDKVTEDFLHDVYVFLAEDSPARCPPTRRVLDQMFRKWAGALLRQEVADLEELLEDCYNGLTWYLDEYPETVSAVDYEKVAEVEEILRIEDPWKWQEP